MKRMKRSVLILMTCVFSFVLANSSASACTRNSDGTWKYCCPAHTPKHLPKNVKADQPD